MILVIIMKKIGILEVVVILSILITSISLAYKFYSNNGNDYEFDGNQMYKCAWVCEKILNKNFPLNATITGKWTLSKKPFNGEVVIYDAKGGTLYAIYNGTPITIGGELAYQEDIAAKKIILHPIGKSIIFYELDPVKAEVVKEQFDTYVSPGMKLFFIDQVDNTGTDQSVADFFEALDFDEAQITELLFHRIWGFYYRDSIR